MHAEDVLAGRQRIPREPEQRLSSFGNCACDQRGTRGSYPKVASKGEIFVVDETEVLCKSAKGVRCNSQSKLDFLASNMAVAR